MSEEELFAFFEKEMQFLPCESPSHDQSAIHQGPGIWYQTSSCPVCGEGPPRALVCDRYKQLLPTLVDLAGDTAIQCSHCEEYFLSREIVYVFERRLA